MPAMYEKLAANMQEAAVMTHRCQTGRWNSKPLKKITAPKVYKRPPTSVSENQGMGKVFKTELHPGKIAQPMNMKRRTSTHLYRGVTSSSPLDTLYTSTIDPAIARNHTKAKVP